MLGESTACDLDVVGILLSLNHFQIVILSEYDDRHVGYSVLPYDHDIWKNRDRIETRVVLLVVCCVNM